jgi:hypothetical protein
MMLDDYGVRMEKAPMDVETSDLVGLNVQENERKTRSEQNEST